jgi:hypothetical protein
MPNSRDRTYSLILRVTQDFLQSIRARRRLSIMLMIIGVLLVVTGFVFLDGGPGQVLNVITAAAGLTVGSSSFFPINELIKLNLKIKTLERLKADLENADETDDEDAEKIEAIIWKFIEQTVIS